MVPQKMEPFLNHFFMCFKVTGDIQIRIFKIWLYFWDESPALSRVLMHLSNTWLSTLSWGNYPIHDYDRKNCIWRGAQNSIFLFLNNSLTFFGPQYYFNFSPFVLNLARDLNEAYMQNRRARRVLNITKPLQHQPWSYFFNTFLFCWN